MALSRENKRQYSDSVRRVRWVRDVKVVQNGSMYLWWCFIMTIILITSMTKLKRSAFFHLEGATEVKGCLLRYIVVKTQHFCICIYRCVPVASWWLCSHDWSDYTFDLWQPVSQNCVPEFLRGCAQQFFGRLQSLFKISFNQILFEALSTAAWFRNIGLNWFETCLTKCVVAQSCLRTIMSTSPVLRDENNVLTGWQTSHSGHSDLCRFIW